MHGGSKLPTKRWGLARGTGFVGGRQLVGAAAMALLLPACSLLAVEPVVETPPIVTSGPAAAAGPVATVAVEREDCERSVRAWPTPAAGRDPLPQCAEDYLGSARLTATAALSGTLVPCFAAPTSADASGDVPAVDEPPNYDAAATLRHVLRSHGGQDQGWVEVSSPALWYAPWSNATDDGEIDVTKLRGNLGLDLSAAYVHREPVPNSAFAFASLLQVLDLVSGAPIRLSVDEHGRVQQVLILQSRQAGWQLVSGCSSPINRALVDLLGSQGFSVAQDQVNELYLAMVDLPSGSPDDADAGQRFATVAQIEQWIEELAISNAVPGQEAVNQNDTTERNTGQAIVVEALVGETVWFDAEVAVPAAWLDDRSEPFEVCLVSSRSTDCRGSDDWPAGQAAAPMQVESLVDELVADVMIRSDRSGLTALGTVDLTRGSQVQILTTASPLQLVEAGLEAATLVSLALN